MHCCLFEVTEQRRPGFNLLVLYLHSQNYVSVACCRQDKGKKMPTLKILWETIKSIQSKSTKFITGLHAKKMLLAALPTFIHQHTELKKQACFLIYPHNGPLN